MLNVLGFRLTYQGQAEANAEAWFNIALRPRKPEGSLGRTAQDGHLDFHAAPELCRFSDPALGPLMPLFKTWGLWRHWLMTLLFTITATIKSLIAVH